MFSRTTSRVATAFALLAALAVPLVTDNAYFLDVLIMCCIWAIAASGMNVLLGYTGQLNLAHAGFFGIGAYATGILSLKLKWSFWLALPSGILITAILGLLLGLIAFRTRGDAFAIFTLAVGVIITSIAQRWTSLTGGRDGLNGVPQPDPIGPLRFDEPQYFYYLALAALVATLWVVSATVRSPVGRSFVAVRSNEDLARASGIDVYNHKLRALMLSTALAGLAGGLYAGYLGFLGYAVTSVNTTFTLLLYVIIGGVATLAGPVIGAFVILILMQWLQAFQEAQLLILGPLLVVLVLFAPNGLMGLWARLTRPGRRPGKTVPAPVVPTGKEG